MRDSTKIPFYLNLKDSVHPPPPPFQDSPPNRVSTVVLFIVVIIAIIFFIYVLLHLLFRLLTRKQAYSDPTPEPNLSPGPTTVERQLQQLFHLHDSGLDQTMIDFLPVFLYREILGPKEPFDCAICLCEFLLEDKLRLLPGCGHAFHLECIDTWLLSNSTCPLCRGSLGLVTEDTDFELGNSIEEDDWCEDSDGSSKLEEEKIVYRIRLGKFKNLSKLENSIDAKEGNGNVGREIGETSSSNLDARRCFSMGSYQYILANSSLQVACTSVRGRSLRFVGSSTSHEMPDERKISASTRGESMSVSKIWQRPGQWGDVHASSLQGNSILIRLPVMEERGGNF